MAENEQLNGITESFEDQQAAFDAKVRENYPANRVTGIMHGILHFTGLGFYWPNTVIPKFIFDLTGSDFMVGLTTSLGMFANQAAQLYGSAMVEHLAEKKRSLIWYGIWARAPWLLIAMAIMLLTREMTLPVVLILYFVASAYMGLYLLVWTDLMSKIIPVEFRGSYFGVRNFAASSATALAGIVAGRIIEQHLYPGGYAISFFIAFLVMTADLFVLARTKEVPAIRVNPQVTVMQKLRSIPTYFAQDRNFARYCYIRSFSSISRAGFPFYILAAASRLGLTPQESAATVGTFTFALLVIQTFGNLFWGFFSQKRGWKLPLALSCLLVGIVSFIVPSLTTMTGFITVVAISGLSNSGFMLPSMNILMEFGKSENRPTYIGIASGISSVGAFLAPLLAGTVAQQYSYGALFYLIGVASIISFILLHFFVVDPRFVKPEEIPVIQADQ
jgi:MFS family permease